MQYFNHDTDAGNDSKIVALRMFYGHGAVDCYWTLAELVYRDEQPLPDTRYAMGALAQSMGASIEEVEEWIAGMVDIGLVSRTDDGIISERMEKNIAGYKAKIKKLRENAKAGGKASAQAKAKQKPSKSSSNCLTKCQPNAQPFGQACAQANGQAKANQNKIKENKGFAEQSSARQTPDCGSGADETAAAESEEDFTIDIDELMRELMADA